MSSDYFNSLGYNLVGNTSGSTGWNGFDHIGTGPTPLNPNLGPLANNGGLTQTMLPFAGSTGIDQETNTYIPPDQRGLPRICNGTVDIGAVECSNP